MEALITFLRGGTGGGAAPLFTLFSAIFRSSFRHFGTLTSDSCLVAAEVMFVTDIFATESRDLGIRLARVYDSAAPA